MNPLNFKKHIPFFLRKRFKEKFIIIESDDWGLERAQSCKSIGWMERKFGKDKFSRWSCDCLETSEDLEMLFDLLEDHKGKFEFPPIITANFITHNVDYTSPEELRFIPISKGFNSESEDVRELYLKGIRDKHIFPQLHGYSHYNLTALREYFQTDEGREAFENKFLFARSTIKGNLTFLHGEFSRSNGEAHRVREASEEFRRLFGFYSASIIPPSYIFDEDLLKSLKENHITLIQSANRLIKSSGERYSYPHFNNRKGIYWSIRNSRLDPVPGYEFYHEQCVRSIANAFKYGTPAVIDFHRVNFAGKYRPEYRDKTLKELRLLLDEIHVRWPDARFLHSQMLNDMLWQRDLI